MLNNVEPAGQFHAVAAWNVDPEMATLPAFTIGAPHQALEGTPEIAIDDLVFTVVAAFRRQPHLNNVLTHISGAGRASTARHSRPRFWPGPLAAGS